MLIVADARPTFLLSGTGDLIEPTMALSRSDRGVLRDGGGARAHQAQPARRASDRGGSDAIAADICIYTNPNLTIEEL